MVTMVTAPAGRAERRDRVGQRVDGRLGELFTYAGDHGIPLYGPIDEYDNFAKHVHAAAAAISRTSA